MSGSQELADNILSDALAQGHSTLIQVCYLLSTREGVFDYSCTYLQGIFTALLSASCLLSVMKICLDLSLPNMVDIIKLYDIKEVVLVGRGGLCHRKI